MKIRTQLILICFLLAVLPLTAIVVYSYDSSKKALEAAYQNEAHRLTAQMDRRLALIRTDLEQRLAELSALPNLGSGSTQAADVPNILATMGDSASLVDSIEIRPVPAAAPRAREQQRERTEVAEIPERPEPPEPDEADDATAKTDTSLVDVKIAGIGDEVAKDLAKAPVVIELPPTARMAMRFTLTPEQRAQLDQMRKLGMQLGSRGQELSPAEREAIQKQLAEAQQAFEKSMKERAAQFEAQMQEMTKAREEARQMRIATTQAKHATHQAAKAAAATQVAAAPTPAPVPAVAAVPSPALPTIPSVSAPAPPAPPAPHKMTAEDRTRLRQREKQTSLVFGQRFNAPLRQQGKVVGQIQAHISNDEVIRRVLGVESEDRSEIAFAIDRDGNLYTRTPEEKATLTRLGVPVRVASNQSLANIPNWIVVLNRDPQSGLRIGVARPVGDTFEAMRKTAARNYGFGMGVVLLLLIGIVPIANHMTRDVKAVTRGAERVAQGDLMTRVPVHSTKSEIGQLATAFNRMAEDLSLQQQRIVTQERERQEQAMQQRLLEAEYGRKSAELEEARRFQLSLLPKEVPQHEHFDLAVFTRTATEVGGDYYDFHAGANGVLSAAIGDATGHGARAGTMVTAVKALFAGYTSETGPAAFLRDAAEKVKRMDLPRMAMALVIARLERNRVTLASAGMPPVYVHRAATGTVDEIALHATPLGTLGADYRDEVIELAAGDTMLLMTDGFPELLNHSTQQLGYTGAMQEFGACAQAADAQGVIDALEESVRRWHGDTPPNDDVTFVVVRARA